MTCALSITELNVCNQPRVGGVQHVYTNDVYFYCYHSNIIVSFEH